MKINEFVETYKAKRFINTKNSVDERVEYIKSTLEVKKYIPFADKRELCSAVIETCCTKKNGLVEVDSVSRYIAFTIAVISAYTNLEFSSDGEYDPLDEYDMLCEHGLLNPILAIIGDEYDTCNSILNMMMDDVVTNNNTVEAVLGHNLGKVSDSIDDLISAFADKVKEMELDLGQIDIDKFDKLKGLFDLFPKK